MVFKSVESGRLHASEPRRIVLDPRFEFSFLSPSEMGKIVPFRLQFDNRPSEKIVSK